MFADVCDRTMESRRVLVRALVASKVRVDEHTMGRMRGYRATLDGVSFGPWATYPETARDALLDALLAETAS